MKQTIEKTILLLKQYSPPVCPTSPILVEKYVETEKRYAIGKKIQVKATDTTCKPLTISNSKIDGQSLGEKIQVTYF